MEILSLPLMNEPFITGNRSQYSYTAPIRSMKLADASILFIAVSGKAHIMKLICRQYEADGEHPTSASPRQYLQLHLRQP